MSIPSHLAALAAVATAVLSGCETVRTETWTSKSPGASNPFESRMFGTLNSWSDLQEAQAEDALRGENAEEPGFFAFKKRKAERTRKEELSKLQGDVQHSLGDRRVDTTDLFGGTRQNTQFGQSEKFGSKRFRGVKEFGGNKQYGAGSYQFVKDREMAREAAAAAGQQFGEADKAAGEARKKWFGRNKTVGKERAYGFDETVAREPLREAATAQQRNRETPMDIANPGGVGGGPGQMSLDQLREILGRPQ